MLRSLLKIIQVIRMKKLLFCAMVLFCDLSYAVNPENQGILAGKVVIQNPSGYFFLSDGSFWQVYGFVIRSRGFIEWWRGVHLISPEKCDCLPNDWELGSEIETYSKSESFNIDISDADNLAALKKCTHFLVNIKNGQTLFGTPLLPADCMIKIYNDAYHQGYSNGVSWVKFLNDNAYSQGFNAGYQAGRQERYE